MVKQFSPISMGKVPMPFTPRGLGQWRHPAQVQREPRRENILIFVPRGMPTLRQTPCCKQWQPSHETVLLRYVCILSSRYDLFCARFILWCERSEHDKINLAKRLTLLFQYFSFNTHILLIAKNIKYYRC